jgi:hypothetical protein
MRRALVAAALLGVVAGLVLIHRDALRLTVAWPVILGFALWDPIGQRGSRGVVVAASAAVGVALGYVAFGIVAELMPVTDMSLGITSGVMVAVIVLVGVLARERFPMSGMLVGFAAFWGVFEPLWRQSPSNFRSHGAEYLSIAGLALFVGILAATVARGITESVRQRSVAREERAMDEPTTPLSEVLEGGAK